MTGRQVTRKRITGAGISAFGRASKIQTLRHRIEQELVVRMIARDADALERMDMAHLTDGELADEIERHEGISGLEKNLLG
ncbi:MAG: hypothetical protein R2861_04535 [Desulfobacterales bacterium]